MKTVLNVHRLRWITIQHSHRWSTARTAIWSYVCATRQPRDMISKLSSQHLTRVSHLRSGVIC